MYRKSLSTPYIKKLFKEALLLAPLAREELIERTISSLSASDKRGLLRDKERLSVYIASVLQEAFAEETVTLDGDLYRLGRLATLSFSREAVEKEIHSLLLAGGRTKRQIFAHLTKVFSVEKTEAKKDDLSLLSLAGQILKDLVSSGAVWQKDGVLSIASCTLDRALSKEELFSTAFSLLYERGGAFFEKFICGLLEKFFRLSGKKILRCEVSGGADDGGIDCLIDTEDALGFIEYHVIQTKCRRSIHVTEKEIREFFGAMNIKAGTRGLFVTTSTFHPAAKALLDTLPDCVGIDGSGVRQLMERCHYGYLENRDGSFSLDPLIFCS